MLDAYEEFCGIPIPDTNYGESSGSEALTGICVNEEVQIVDFTDSPRHHNGEQELEDLASPSTLRNSPAASVPLHKSNVIKIEYKAAPTIKKFLESKEFVTLLMGPVGSSKSTGCVMKLIMEAHNQKPSFDGVRRTRYAIIRNEFPTLWSTTVKTVGDWVPPELGVVKKTSPPSMWLRQQLPDGTSIESEWLFLALDSEGDNRKLLSLELSGAWVNEVKEVNKSVLDLLETRVGRYPNKRLGGCTRDFIICDTNPPDVTHWVCKLFRNPPEGYQAFFQPSGLSDEAENIENLPEGYYSRLMSGKSKAWIEAYVHGRFSPNFAGKPVYDNFDMGIHVLPKHPDVPKNSHLWIGLDFGLTPAACIGMVEPDGSLIIIDEMVSERSGALQFGEALKRYLHENYRGCTFEIHGDPAGSQASQSDMRTPYDILAAIGINAQPAYTNDFEIRMNAVILMLGTLVNGHAWLRVSPRAEYMISAMAGGYCWRKLRVGGGDKFTDKPDKGPFSHIAEALQYLCMSFNPEQYCKVLRKAEDGGYDINMAKLLQNPINALLTPKGFTSPLQREVHCVTRRMRSKNKR